MRKIRTELERWAALLVGCSLLANVALTPASLRADEGAERAVARQHFAKGVTLAKQRAYAEALDEFQQAYAAVPQFSVLYNIGQAQIALGQSAEAVTTLQRYLDEGGAGVDAKRRAEVQAVIDHEREKAPPKAAPEPTPGSTPPAVAVPASSPQAAAAAPAPVAAPTPTPSDSVPVAAVPPVATSTPPPAGEKRIERSSATKRWPSSSFAVRRGHSFPTKASSAHRRTLAYVVAGTGVALSAAAVLHYAWNRGRYQQWQSKYADYFHDPTEPNRVAANELSESIDKASTVTVLLGIGAGVALGGGTLLWLTDGAPSSDPRSRGLSPFFSAQGTF